MTTPWLNYQHLYYFWMIAREGGLSRAATALHLTHSTLSVQLRALEDTLGEALFERRGRGLVLTPFGREVQLYGNDIFRLGTELLDFSRGRVGGRRRFDVGVVGAIPKTIASQLLAPALGDTADGSVRIRQDSLERLVQELGAGRLHAVLSDVAPIATTALKLHAHLLGASAIELYGAPDLARRYRVGFPRSLANAPMVMPGPDTALRRALERWFADRQLPIRVTAEVDDAGMLRAVGATGAGLFPVRAALRAEVEEGAGARRVGRMHGLEEHYYVVSLERRVTHPGVAALIAVARARLNQSPPLAPARGVAARRPRTPPARGT